jgi:hypothetical protein
LGAFEENPGRSALFFFQLSHTERKNVVAFEFYVFYFSTCTSLCEMLFERALRKSAVPRRWENGKMLPSANSEICFFSKGGGCTLYQDARASVRCWSLSLMA